MRPPFIPLALALCLAASIPGQRTITVDALQRAGYDFTDIPPAVAAARDGDTLLVRDGTYSVFEIAGKAISVQGQPGAVVVGTAGARPVSISGVPAGQDLVLSGLAIRNAGPLGALWIMDCEGRVLLEGLQLNGVANVFFASSQAVLNRCSWTGSFQFHGNVALTDCTGIVTDSRSSLVPALTLVESNATCANCTFISRSSSPFGAAPGISMRQSTLRLAGNASHVVAAATQSASAVLPAIDGDGTLVLDPDITLRPFGGAPPIAAAIRVDRVELPALSVRGAALGQIASVELTAGAGQAYFLFWSRAADAVPLPVLGAELWLDPATIVLARSGTLDRTGTTRFDFRVPPLRGLIGVPFHWQGVSGSPSALMLSNPAGYAHPSD